ncbi:MAG: 1,4-dihydroxy-2-naphthoate polyprenyltransferase [Propionibacteriaceae bacterium]|jgi:1,4-dihydroxy-2-naphthoate octaprenyltransferase|nr:1,4-dihydroxy-2-naphthoate polyprenyltransferase [Propionibacteriaceae bacterium]
MATAREWIEGARLRTLPASIAPVLVGTAVAWFAPTYATGGVFHDIRNWRGSAIILLLCLVVALGFQIGSNFANDYSDGIRGTDDVRVGPMRLVGSGAASPGQVKWAAWISFGVACVAGLVLVLPFVLSAWQRGVGLVVPLVLVVVGLACVLAAWYYTGGKHPYGYVGLGEVFVFVFFGLVASMGTTFVQAPPSCDQSWEGTASWGCGPGTPWLAAGETGVMMGCFATAILVANNLRDLASDQASDKITLPVRLGDRRTRVFYVALIVVAELCLLALAAQTSWWVLLGLLGLLALVRSLRAVLGGAKALALIVVLRWTGLAQLLTAVLIALGLWIGAR